MMKKQIAGIVLAVSVAGGVGTGVLANALTTENPAAADSGATGAASTPTPAPTTSVDPDGQGGQDGQGGEVGMPAPDILQISPGAVGPVKAGMSKSEALATGYFNADVTAPVDGCPERPLEWKDEYVNTYDVLTLGNGEITSIGVRGEGVRTEEGIGIGSTYDEVKAQYPDETLVDAGYSQSGLRVYDPQDGGWIGFLFDPNPETIEGSDRVTFVEVTKGAEPGLMRDGC